VVIGIVCPRIFDDDNDNDRKPSPNIGTAALESPPRGSPRFDEIAREVWPSSSSGVGRYSISQGS